MLSTRDPPQNKRFTQVKMQVENEGMEKIFHANRDGKNLGKQYIYLTKQTSKQGHNKRKKVTT